MGRRCSTTGWCTGARTCGCWKTIGSQFLEVCQTAHKTPTAAELTDREQQLVGTFLQREVDRVVVGADDAEKARIAKVLGAPATEQNLPIQEHRHVIAVADVQLSYLIAVGVDPGSRIHDLHAGLRFQALREAVRERDARMRRVTVPRKDDKAGRLRLHLLPRHAVDLREASGFSNP
jgi:hypothetical protein